LSATLLLARALDPSGFGPVAVCLTAILLIDGVVGASIDTIVVKLATSGDGPSSPDGLAFQKAALTGKLLVTLFVGLPLTLLAGPISSYLFGTAGEPGLILWTVLAAGAVMTLRSAQTYLQVTGRLLHYGIADVAWTALRCGAVLGLVLLGRISPTWALACSVVPSAAVAAAIIVTTARPMAAAVLSTLALTRVFKQARWLVAAAAVGTLTSRIDVFFVSAVGGASQAGVYSAAQVLVTPVAMLGMSLGVAFAPRIMPLWRSGDLAGIYRRFQKWTFAACVGIYAAAALVIGPVTRLLLPASFIGATEVALLLLPAALASLLIFPWTVSLLLFSAPRLLFAWDLVALPLLCVAYRQAIRWGGATGAAGVTAGYALLKAAALQMMAQRELRHALPMKESTTPLVVTG
jgi:O-antigen/teichoic acid export membrane protein